MRGACSGARFVALGHTDALRTREGKFDAVRVHAVAHEASHRNAPMLDLRVAQPACEGSATRVHGAGRLGTPMG